MKLEVFGNMILHVIGTFTMINYYDVHITLLSHVVQALDV